MTSWRAVDSAALTVAASELIWAARTADDEAALAAVDQARQVCGDDAVMTLAWFLAEMVPDDVPPQVLRAWTENREGYLRLRERGLSAETARNALPLLRND